MGVVGNAEAAEVTGQIMVAAIIVLFLVVLFVLFLHLYAKWFWWQTEEATNPAWEARRRRRFVFTPGQDAGAAAVAMKKGLDPAVLRSLEVVVFSKEGCEEEEGLECAVCLCELVDGDKARMLPKCNHGFHVDCIDMWFQSYSTCPLCRNPVAAVEAESVGNGGGVEMVALEERNVSVAAGIELSIFTMESRSYPTNVLFYGNEVQVSSGVTGGEEVGSSVSRLDDMLVLDVARHENVSNSPSSSANGMRFGEEEQKPQLPTRLRTLKRLLSRDKRVMPSSSNTGDVEQGVSRS